MEELLQKIQSTIDGDNNTILAAFQIHKSIRELSLDELALCLHTLDTYRVCIEDGEQKKVRMLDTFIQALLSCYDKRSHEEGADRSDSSFVMQFRMQIDMSDMLSGIEARAKAAAEKVQPGTN